ncbi:MAG: hypothetical protein R3217_01485 [Gammaproteobacteria bacterium]|nr:hypothetical protein [Gammaproteobacteria bacterium]
MKTHDNRTARWLSSLVLASGLAFAPAATAETGSTSAYLARAVTLLHLEAQAQIRADISATLKAMPLIIYQPYVTTGPVRLIAARAKTSQDGNKAVARVQKSAASDDTADSMDDVQRDLLHKTLAAPGVFGMYRTMVHTSTGFARIVATKQTD